MCCVGSPLSLWPITGNDTVYSDYLKILKRYLTTLARFCFIAGCFSGKTKNSNDQQPFHTDDSLDIDIEFQVAIYIIFVFYINKTENTKKL